MKAADRILLDHQLEEEAMRRSLDRMSRGLPARDDLTIRANVKAKPPVEQRSDAAGRYFRNFERSKDGFK
ncbi:MAG: hypothetical protein E5Y02_10390 [Mesorhizobium sp.]|nr:MAG: hypothetical protein E5Y02_10390 [Mesorhizobium sp.]